MSTDLKDSSSKVSYYQALFFNTLNFEVQEILFKPYQAQKNI